MNRHGALVLWLVGLAWNSASGGEPDATPPIVVRVTPAPDSVVPALVTVEVAFSEPVTGLDAGDLLINGAPATNVWVPGPQQYVFEFPQPAPGWVSLAWASDHGITDLAELPNRFAGENWTCLLDTNPPAAGVILNEFLAVNHSGLRDEDGDTPDWIELLNTHATTVSLDGWFLTDDPGNLTRWRFPNVTLEPGSLLLVFASGKNRTNDLHRLHTSFQLSSQGEFLALVNARTNVVSAFTPAYPPQQADVSYGRDRVSQELVGSFATPTPGAPNADAGPGFAPEVRFSVEGGTFVHPFPLYLSTSDPQAVIHCLVVIGTGSTGLTNAPTTASSLYTNPIPITSTVQVRARAFRPGYLPGPPRTETYIQLDPAVLDFSSDLPIILIHNLGQGAVPTLGDQAAYVAIFDKDKDTGRATLASRPAVHSRVGLNIRGRGSQGYPKSAFAVEFWDEYNQDKNVEVLGMPAESDWVLYAPLDTEPVLIHNPLAREMSNLLGRQASRTRFVEVFLNTAGGPVRYLGPTNGDYNGIYVVIEKIKRGEGRVNVASLDPEDISPDTISGGYIFKSDEPMESDEYAFAGARQLITMVYPGKRSLAQPQRAAQLNYVRGYFNSFSNALFGPNWTNAATGYAPFIEIDSWIDHSIVSVTTFNVDAIRLSGYFYKDRNKPLEMGPVWDCDRSLGATDGRQFNPRFWRGQGGDQGTDYFNAPGPGPAHFWYGQLFRDIDFWQRYIDRYQAARRGPYALTNLYALIDRMVSEVGPAQPREQAKWGHLAPPRNTNGIGPGSFATEVVWLKTWLANRLDFMDTNFLDQPRFNTNAGLVPHGFSLTLTGPTEPGTQIYFTLDGADPRAPAGTVAPNALLYRDGISVTTNSRVVARSYNPAHRNLTGRDNPPLSSPWSGPNAGTFMVHVPPLVITEIMYHPSSPSTGDPTDPDDFEYLELKNRGPAPLDLVGFRITNGIDFVFTPTNAVTRLAPGDYVLVVKNRAAFHARYPGVTNVAGEYQGNLANDGNRLGLVGPVAEPILDFRYEDAWVPVTDGSGFSLVIVEENGPLAAWGTPTSWRASTRWQGSPAGPDAPPPTIAPIRVNEVLAHSVPPAEDAIELYNPTAEPVNLGGWFLTDDFDRPTKYRIPDDTIIPAGGYRYFTEAQFGAPGLPGSFAFSRLGDEVYLFSGDGPEITGYFHGFDFGASDAGVSFGRHLTSAGEEQLVAQAAVTLGAANAGPAVGPIVVREIASRPQTLLFGSSRIENPLQEYLELHNITDAPVPLYDTNHPANTWKVTGGVEFTFPSGVWVPPRSSVVVVRFDPNLDPFQLESFRLQSGFADTVPLYGPFRGRLGNEDDEINVCKPGLPVAPPAPDAGWVPCIRLEQVAYSSQPPWPTNAGAGGTNAVLRRVSLTGYANDRTNWVAVLVPRPTLDQPPWSQGVPPGSTATFSVAAHGAGTLSYQWRFNGTDLPGATSATLTLNNVELAHAGWYDVRVTDLHGSVLSPLAALTMLIGPLVLQQPQGAFPLPGTDLNLTVAVTNTATLPISYRWRRGPIVVSTALLDAHTATLAVPRIQPGQAGGYTVIISNAALAQSTGLVSSLAPVVTVVPPSNVVARAGSNVTLRSSVSGGLNNPVGMQWLFHRALLPRQTNATLTVTNVQAGNEGLYTLFVTNAVGATASYPAGLGLLTPVVLSDPAWLLPGSFRVSLQGIPWQHYQIQFTTNLDGWQPLTALDYTNGLMPVLDVTAPPTPRRFYRAVLAP